MSCLPKQRILMLITCFAVSNTRAQRADTTFILREIQQGTYHAVFIDPHPQTSNYAAIGNFRLNKNELKSYAQQVSQLKTGNRPLKKHLLHGLPAQWCSLYLYQGAYYLYAPSDYLFNYRIVITNSVYTDLWGDGPQVAYIDSLQQTAPSCYSITLSNTDGSQKNIHIYIIDKQKGIAVFEDFSAAPNELYRLMADASKLEQFPVIVNYCASQKQREYHFATPDFPFLLSRCCK